ncbi:epidermal growth factor receptor [Trichuris trichiura]|uniref:receptor protein-tyrosine kinase n=1 Tax=Trichuris trichiura TaxID=36087 RepID=A0A077Z161_TRITR|nr:epidermal growth factor receptor [Trichuris trichiura]
MCYLALQFGWFMFFSLDLVTAPWKTCSPESHTCGTENGLNKLEVQEKKIDRLRLMYANCTIVHGNLEITYLNSADLDNTSLSTFNFFSGIEEVTGYVLIAHNSIHNFSLPRLRIIWGDKKFRPASGQNIGQFSLLVLNNAFEHLGLPELRVIHDGSIGVQLNRRMCHWKTLDYRQLLGDKYNSRLQLKDSHQDCNSPNDWSCDFSCTHCWGPEANECQEAYRDNCAPQCSSGMCFGKYNPQYCCHAECAAGCHGPSDRDCYGCRAMRDDGRCVDKCPTPELYDPVTTQYIKNPNGKYAFNRECVTVCPPHMVIYKDGCVSRCPEGYFAEVGSNVCEPCQGVCPKTCIIEHHVSSFNIKDFIGCTKVDGFIEIRKDTFEYGALFLANDSFVRYDPMSEEQLEALSSVRQVTHYVLIQSERLKSLSFLRNLEKIEGRKLFESSYALYITHSFSMQYLGTVSLRSILNGDVYIASNYDLCYIHNIPWGKRIISVGHSSRVRSNRKADVCELEGKVCDPSCDLSQGCWGPGPEMCFDCMHWRLGNSCVDECNADGLYRAAPKQCAYCHVECTKCTGAGPRNCTECKHVGLDGECVPSCPKYTHFENVLTRRCEKCHLNCYGYGCTGPGNFVGPGGCKRCKYGVLDEESQTITRCLQELSAEKPCSHDADLENYYWTVPLSRKIQKSVALAVCIKCHPVCRRCYGFGTDYAHYGCECLKYSLRESSNSTTCVLECPRNTYIATPLRENDAGECIPCDPQCNSCTGPESTDCLECLHYKDFITESDKFNCTSSCPEERPFVSQDRLCTDVDIMMEKHKKSQVIIGVVVAALVSLCILFFICLLFIRPKASLLAHFKEPNPKLEIVAEVTPNLARLLLIRDFELNRGGVLGYELKDIFVKMAKDPGRYLVVEGDALLRLPAYTPQDQREMIRQLIDDPEVVDPDEYFSAAPTSSPPVSPTMLRKPLIEDREARVSCCNQRHTSAVSQRYASDPLKNMPGLNTSKFSDSPTLTTDVENYLIPDSQQAPQGLSPCDDGVFMAYGSSGELPCCTGGHSYYNEFGKPNAGICLENLEYMQGSLSEQDYHNCMPKNLQMSDIVQNETVV